MKKAFTLAEVLITLAIIGIVAALTIPTLIQNYQEKAWDTAKDIFEKRLKVATDQMNIAGELAGYASTTDFINELKKYIKITKICNNKNITECFSDTVVWNEDSEAIEIEKIKNAEDMGQKDWGTETVAVQFANGVNALIAYNPQTKQEPYNNRFASTASSIAILYDVTGFAKPNTSDKDIGSINVNSLKHECFIEKDGICYGKPFYPEPVTYAECQEMFKSGRYGIEKGCRYDKDYWAGAVKACDGTKNMPTFNEYYSLKISTNHFNKLMTAFSEAPSNSSIMWVGDNHRYDYYGNCGKFYRGPGTYSCDHSIANGIAICKE